MRKFDANEDGFVVASELKAQGCEVRPILFKHADKNNDGKLSKGELRKASEYMIRNRCPKRLIILGTILIPGNTPWYYFFLYLTELL